MAVPGSAGERKQVTVLFVDVVGSMELTESLDPEDWKAIMDRFFRSLSTAVARFGGTVDKFTGDGIMALFGAPVSYEDHARRACAAALHMRDVTAGFNLRIRIGINSGEVVVGGIGEGGRLEYTALGHTVGLAQRMEGIAEPGAIYLTDQTARLVRSHFTVTELGPRSVKGSSAPVQVLVLEGAAQRRVTAATAVPMVGRADEVGVLEAALARAQEGEAQLIGIVGEAGVGKSRLCDEFARSAAAKGVRVRRAAGVSHALEAPLLPILELLRDYFEITDADTPDEARHKIGGRMLDLDPAFEESLGEMYDFMEVPDAALPAPRVSPEVRMERIFAIIAHITRRRTARETLMLLLEDLHWFDDHSVAFVARLTQSFPGTRTLLLTNFRPEFSPPWADDPAYTQLPLDPLDPVAVARMLAGMLGRDPSVDSLKTQVAETTGGSPFFVEEVVRSLAEDGTLAGEPGAYRLARPVKALGVPATVQATLAARIDRLDDADKAVLQTAAVVGRHFTEPVLRLAARTAIADSVERLCAAEYLQLTGQGEYRFWHPLTQEVAYRGLLRERRAALHRRVAHAIIAIERDGQAGRAALLATHFERAGDSVEAARWNSEAAEYALRSDINEAVRRWHTVVDQVRASSSDQALRLGIQAVSRLIRYEARTGGDPEDAQRWYTIGIEMAERLGDLTQHASVTFAHASAQFWRGEVRAGHELYTRAAEYADQTAEDSARAAYWGGVTMCRAWAGPVEPTFALIETVLDLCDGDAAFGAATLGYSPFATTGFGRAEMLYLTGRVAEARTALDEMTAGARERGEAELLGWASTMYSRIARTVPEFEAGLAVANQVLGAAEASGNTAALTVALGSVGIAQVGLGRFEMAIGTLDRALRESRVARTGLFEEARHLDYLARAQFGLGRADGALDTVGEAIRIAHRQGAPFIEAHARLTRAEILRARGEDAAADLDAVRAIAHATGAALFEAGTLPAGGGS